MSSDLAARPTTAAAPPVAGGRSRHGPLAQLLIAWSPLSVILVAYGLAAWVTAPLDAREPGSTNRFGIGLDRGGPAAIDEAVLGVVPPVWLQQASEGPATQVLDVLAAVVYITHFVAIPIVTALAWFGLRRRFAEWLAMVLGMSLAGIAVYLLHPAAPPWLDAEQGVVAPVERTSHLGWQHIGLDPVAHLVRAGQEASNPVAAVPSLHAGAALLVALFLWPSVKPLARSLLAAYALAMAWCLVHTGEHYVVDIVLGWTVATLTVVAVRAHRRRSTIATSPSSAGTSGASTKPLRR